MSASHTKVETDTEITYTPIQGFGICSYVVLKDNSKLDVHVICISSPQTWQQLVADLDTNI